MKKLIIAACVIALAGLSQAATVGWGYGGSISNADAKSHAYQFFIIGQGTHTTDKDYIVTSSSQIINMITQGTDVSKYAFGSGMTGANGLVNVTAASSGKTIVETSTTDVYYEAFMVVFDNADISKATKYLLIENGNCGTKDGFKKALNQNSATVAFTAGNVGTYVNNGSNWKNVPEPTSGLLMLLGVASLALRRRRA